MSCARKTVSIRNGLFASACFAMLPGLALGGTQLSLQESGLNVTANHSGNQVVNIHLDSFGPSAAAYGIVGRADPQGRAVPAVAPIHVVPAPAIVQSRQAVDWSTPHEPGELLVCYDRQWLGGVKRPSADPAMRREKDALHARMGAKLHKELRLINADVIKVPAGMILQAAAHEYAKEPGVTHVQPNYIYQAIGLPNDPHFPFVPSSLGPPQNQIMWGLHATAQNGVAVPSGTAFDSDIDAAEAWEVTTGSSDVVVAVIDTGVQYTHADIAANMWTNPGEIAGNSLDDDGNGFVDDIHGYDFKNNDGDPNDDHYHGTHVAGTIGAVANNALNVAGVAWNVRIMALKFLGANGRGTTADAIDCVDYCVLMGVPISNNSWGGGGFDAALLAAINNAGAAGHLFLAAAGNDTMDTDITPHYPSTYNLDTIISVAAWDKTQALAWFSNYGATTTDLAAPGDGIYSLQLGGGITSLSGTSMATPHVAGVAALLKCVRPEAGPLQIKDWILDGVTPHPNLAGKVLTGGRLNAVEPLRLATMPWLRVDSREGIIAAGGSVTIPVTFVTQTIPVGMYSGSLIVLDLSYDNAVTPRIEIPVTMDLQFVELPPVVQDVFLFVVQNTNKTVTLVGSDPNIGQSVTFTITSLPAQGTLIDVSTTLPITSVPHPLAGGVNTVTYSPAPNQIYMETFQYTATDGTNTSNVGTVTLDVVAPPNAPQDVSAYSGNTFVDVNWLPSVEANLAGYNVHVAPNAGGPFIKITSNLHTDTTFRHYPGGGSPTYYAVTAVLDNGAESAYSASASGQPTFASQWSPHDLRATAGNAKVYLEWEAPWEFFGTYWIVRSLPGGVGAEIIWDIHDQFTTTFVDGVEQTYSAFPENGVTYEYYVENYSYWDGWGASSNLVMVTPNDSTWPSAPTGLQAVGGVGFVDVTWDANPELDIEGYWVFRATAPGGPHFYQDMVQDRRFYDLAVAPFTTYYYVIAAVDLDGEESDFSVEVSATTGGDTTPPAAPTNLTATPGDGVVHLDWNDNNEPDFAVYVWYRSLTSGGPYEEIDNDTPSNFSDYNVVNGTPYCYVITAKDLANNESGYSNEACATPQEPVPCDGPEDCDDGVYCNGAEVCTGGSCQPGAPDNCNDGIACTADSCNEATDSCDHAVNNAACNDGLYCNGVESCSAQFGCQAGTPVNCNDGVACTQDTCNEATDSCNYAPNNANCDDSLYCSGAETCHATLGCQAGMPVACNDGVACTQDTCNEATDACNYSPNNSNCDDGLYCNGAETCHATLGCQAGSNPCPGQGCNESTDSCVSLAEVWLSFIDSAAVPGVGTAENEDIIARSVASGAWSLVFDGSDVGLSGLTIDGLARMSDGSILLSFAEDSGVPGMTGGPSGTTLDDSDIVRFVPTSLGANTAGSFVFYFDGSDVGLTNNNEDIDAIALTSSGQLVISTLGAATANGASAADTDLLLFNATSLGSVTAGTFSVYFDGSDVGLTDNGNEDVDAVAVRSTGVIILSTLGAVSVPGVSGADEDVLQFTPTQLGPATSGSYSMYLDLSAIGIATSENVGAVEYKE